MKPPIKTAPNRLSGRRRSPPAGVGIGDWHGLMDGVLVLGVEPKLSRKGA